MIKEINYKGVTETPSDYESLDGELSISMNAIQEGQGVKPILPPTKVMQIEDKRNKLAYIHRTAKIKHCIFVVQNTDIYWSDFKNEVKVKDMNLVYQGTSRIVNVSSIGNVIIVITENAVNYVLWKKDRYEYLGEHLPELNLKFGLVGKPVVRSNRHSYRDDESLWDSMRTVGKEMGESAQNGFTSEVMAEVNKFINEEATEKDKFVLPFLVRYAYRLYDGSITMHSAPILMTPTLTDAPLAYIPRIWQDGSSNHLHFYYNVGAMVCDLHMLAERSAKEMLEDWGDIVKSVDIFVSKPLYTHDQSGKIKKFGLVDEKNVNFIGCVDEGQGINIPRKLMTDNGLKENEIQNVDGFKCHKEIPFISNEDFHDKARGTWHDDNGSWNKWGAIFKFVLPEKNFNDEVSRTSQFFLIKSIPIKDLPIPLTDEEVHDIHDTEDIPNPYKKIELRKGTLKSLVNREAMTDDYDSHDKITPKHTYVYNARLNMANIRKEAFRGFPLSACTQHTSTSFKKTVNEVKVGEHTERDPQDPDKEIIVPDYEYETVYKLEGFKIMRIIYIARKDGKNVAYSEFRDETFSPDTPILYLYHPDPDVHKAKVLTRGGHFYDYYEVDMERHAFLNGSFHFSMIEPTSNKGGTAPDTEPFYIDLPNKIYTSEVNNPFFFPVRNINTVGTGEILGLSSSTKAISSGQFGQFPMYAFSSEGVWALEVSSTGGFSARQPVTRDVCNNPSSITQLDTSVLFTTDRGIMMLSGGDSTCISQVLDSPQPFLLSSLPNADKLPSVRSLGDEAFKNVPFKEYLKGAHFAFDYVGQRILMFAPNRGFAYVFSINSKAWGMIPCDWERAISSYPNTLVQDTNGGVYDLTIENVDYTNDEEPITALLVTRPLKLDDADVLKTIDTIIQRGKFRRNDIMSVLYGSRDLYKWIPVWSSKDMYMRGFRGTPYKYYRLLLGCSFENDGHISGCTIRYSARQVNQPR